MRLSRLGPFWKKDSIMRASPARGGRTGPPTERPPPPGSALAFGRRGGRTCGGRSLIGVVVSELGRANNGTTSSRCFLGADAAHHAGSRGQRVAVSRRKVRAPLAGTGEERAVFELADRLAAIVEAEWRGIAERGGVPWKDRSEHLLLAGYAR